MESLFPRPWSYIAVKQTAAALSPGLESGLLGIGMQNSGLLGRTSGRGWVEGVPEEVLAQINCCCGKKTVCTTLFTSIFIERSISDLSGRGPIFYILLFLFPLFSSFSEVSLTIKV